MNNFNLFKSRSIQNQLSDITFDPFVAISFLDYLHPLNIKVMQNQPIYVSCYRYNSDKEETLEFESLDDQFIQTLNSCYDSFERGTLFKNYLARDK